VDVLTLDDQPSRQFTIDGRGIAQQTSRAGQASLEVSDIPGSGATFRFHMPGNGVTW